MTQRITAARAADLRAQALARWQRLLSENIQIAADWAVWGLTALYTAYASWSLFNTPPWPRAWAAIGVLLVEGAFLWSKLRADDDALAAGTRVLYAVSVLALWLNIFAIAVAARGLLTPSLTNLVRAWSPLVAGSVLVGDLAVRHGLDWLEVSASRREQRLAARIRYETQRQEQRARLAEHRMQMQLRRRLAAKRQRALKAALNASRTRAILKEQAQADIARQLGVNSLGGKGKKTVAKPKPAAPEPETVKKS